MKSAYCVFILFSNSVNLTSIRAKHALKLGLEIQPMCFSMKSLDNSQSNYCANVLSMCLSWVKTNQSRIKESTYTTNSNQLSSNLTCKFCFTYMGVSENNGTPKSSDLIGFSIINHPFWGTPIFGNTHILQASQPIFGCVGHRVSCIVGFMAHPIVLWMALRYQRCLGVGVCRRNPIAVEGCQ